MPTMTAFPEGVLSDHAYQSTLFSAQIEAGGHGHDIISNDAKATAINVGTWNLQNNGTPKDPNKPNSYSNNPYNMKEDLNAYTTRKKAQIKQIMSYLAEGKEDLMFLQEVDFLVDKSNLKAKTLDQSTLYAAQKTLRDDFIKELTQYGFELIMSTEPRKNQQPMATLYKTSKLTLDANSIKGVLNTGLQFRGLEATFTVNGKNPAETLVTTNLHLNYGEDYKSTIEQYQKSMEKKGVFHVMGGDTNNVQKENLNTALGDWGHATNFSSYPENGNLILTTEHNETQKAYDRFFVVPPMGRYVVAKANDDRNQEVKIVNGAPVFTKTQNSRPSRTLVDERWRRGVDMLRELYDERERATEESKPALTQKMKNIATIKDISILTFEAEEESRRALLLKPPAPPKQLITRPPLILGAGTDTDGFRHEVIESNQIDSKSNSTIASTISHKKGALNDNQRYKVSQLFSEKLKQEAILIQDNTGKVSDHSTNLTEEQKKVTAIAMLKLYAISNDMTKPLRIKGGDLVLVAMLSEAVKEMYPATPIAPSTRNKSSFETISQLKEIKKIYFESKTLFEKGKKEVEAIQTENRPHKP